MYCKVIYVSPFLFLHANFNCKLVSFLIFTSEKTIFFWLQHILWKNVEILIIPSVKKQFTAVCHGMIEMPTRKMQNENIKWDKTSSQSRATIWWNTTDDQKPYWWQISDEVLLHGIKACCTENSSLIVISQWIKVNLEGGKEGEGREEMRSTLKKEYVISHWWHPHSRSKTDNNKL